MIIDGHNDLVSQLWRGDEIRHVHLERQPDADFAGGFFALYVPSPKPPAAGDGTSTRSRCRSRSRRDEAARIADELYEIFRALPVSSRRAPDDFRPGRVAAILHLEGAEPLAAGSLGSRRLV